MFLFKIMALIAPFICLYFLIRWCMKAQMRSRSEDVVSYCV